MQHRFEDKHKTNITSCSRPAFGRLGGSNVLWRRRWLSNQPRWGDSIRCRPGSSGIRPGCRAHDRRGAEAQQEQETLANRHLLTNSSRCLQAGCFFWGGWWVGSQFTCLEAPEYMRDLDVSVFLNPPGCILGVFFETKFTYRKPPTHENVKSC